MTAQIVDEMTDTPSDKNRECVGQGIANFVSGLFGGMAGCAMIGQSVINVKSGGRGRLSTFAAGIYLLLLIVVGGAWVRQIPMPALVAVMIMVSIGTFSWASFKNLRVHPKSTSLVMIATVGVVVWTHNLALGVGVGVLLSALSFARKVAQIILISSEYDASAETRRYLVRGQVFFASAPEFLAGFDFKEAVAKVIVDVSHAHFWDLTSVGALDKVVLKFRREGCDVEILGLNEASATIVDRLAIHDNPAALERLLEH
jgi:SulP family sulfate permease